MANTMKQEWDNHWTRMQESSIFGGICEFYRARVISGSVCFYLDKFFDKEGCFAELGSGTAQASERIEKLHRKIIALDISLIPLSIAVGNGKIDLAVGGDLFALPFKNDSLDGIWNLGVMEHFSKIQIDTILREFYRVLKRGKPVILFWPIWYAPYEIFLDSVSLLAKRLFGKKIKFFPDEPSRLGSKKEGREILLRNSFSDCRVYFSSRDWFTYGVVVAFKADHEVDRSCVTSQQTLELTKGDQKCGSFQELGSRGRV